MKAALITEEQIKTLESLLHHGTEWELAAVLSDIIKSLKVREPVAWIQKDHLQKAMEAPFLCRVEPTQRMADFVPIHTTPLKTVNEFAPDWDQIKPYHDRIAELEAELSRKQTHEAVYQYAESNSKVTIKPKREWQGLSNAEALRLAEENEGKYPFHVAYSWAVEQLLKEKNT